MQESNKVVIKLPDGIVKGYLSAEEIAAYNESPDVGRSVHVRLAEGEEMLIDLSRAKGVFFVKDFGGKVDHEDIRFHDTAQTYDFLWVRLTFLDGEVMEGMIENGPSFVVSKGIWVTPTDPTSNNILIYAQKSHLQHFEVLGMRQKLNRRAT